MSRRAWWCYLVVALVGVPVYFFAVNGFAQRLLFYAYGLSSVVAILLGLRLNRPQQRGPWLAFAGGLLLFALGDVAFDVYAAFGHTLPVPSVADYLYLAAYPVLAWGMVLLVRHRVRGADVASALDGVMVAIGVGVLAWVFIMAPYAHDHELSVPEKLVPIAYPALDLLLVAVIVRLLLSRGVQNASFRLLSASVLALLAADGFYAYATLHNRYSDGNIIDLGWILSYALWGAAALHPSMSRLTEPAPAEQARRSRVALFALGVAALTSPVTLVVDGLRGGGADEALLAAASAIMFGLVIVRLSLVTKALHSSNEQLAKSAARQLVLTDAALAFVSAEDIESAARTAVQAVVALSDDPGSWSSFVAMSSNGTTIVAVAGPAPWEVGAVVSEMSAGWYERAPTNVPVLLPSHATRGEGDETSRLHYVAPLIVDDHMRGKLVVSRITRGADEIVSVLELVSSQMGLALQSIEATEERLRARNERQFRSLVQNSSDGVTLIGRDGVVRYQSPGVRAIIGPTNDHRVSHPLGMLIHPDDAAGTRAQLTKVLSGGLGATANFECRVGHADGSWRDVDTVLTNLLDDPDVEAVVLNSRDVTERRTLERELNRQAFHDSLTELANRALFVDRVAHALDRADRQAGPVAVLFIDIDDFKLVNDSLGHPAGDELLVAVAERLRASIRPGDTVARFGGDEFALLLESGEMPKAAHEVAGRVAEALSTPIRIGREHVHVSASIGIALGQPPLDGPDGLLRDADLAMYMAKHNGKGRFEMFRPEMHEEAVHRLELAADLRRGIELGQFEVYYQPIVSVQKGTAIGAEALVRWHHPKRGLVPPVEFIPIAESTGLVVALGKWVLGEACRQVQSWREEGVVDNAFYISVNLSGRQLQDPALLDDVAAAIRDSGFPARGILLEVTESILMADLDAALARLQSLKDLGLRLAVDDFGTGYSSLSYLRNFPMDVVKIDKSFVDRITLDAEGVALVRSVVELSHALALTTIAEGVEREDQLAVLDELGCDNVQGYLFARPTPAAQFAEALTTLRSNAERLVV